MKIAVTYGDGQVFQHFGHCENFKVYIIENKEIISTEIIQPTEGGHGALAGFLQGNKIEALICGGIGGGAKVALGEMGIQFFAGVQGSADAAVDAYIKGELAYNPDATCNHHHEDGHECGEHKHSCGGN